MISGFCIRNSFCKGMLYCFDFHEFARQYAKTDFIEDIWGNSYNIYEADVILTESMLKLWQSYNSYEDYNEHCQKNGYTFSVTKVSPHILEDTRTLNYQFIQTYDLSDEDLRKLCKPTISEYKDILGLDINKTILFTKGKKMSKDKIKELDYDIFTALMIEPSLINDKFVRTKIYKLLKKRIEQAKIGKIKVSGNYQLISGDPFMLCQSMFNLEKKGLLKEGECYSQYWIDNNVGEVTCFRAPMSSRNNIVKLNLSNNKDASFWYQYMNTIFILNGWDMSTHSLNGCDFDGDLLLSTNNSVLQNNTKNNLPILCVQKNAEKFIVTEKLSSKGNKASFGDEIGSITNKITSMFDLQCLFDKDSREYKTLDYRVLCGQQLQQNSIDKAKGIISKPMPKNWYNIFSIIKNNDLSDEEKNTLKSICVNKKPYFMNYIYPKDMKSYKKYIEDSNRKCLISFGMPIKELQEKRYKNKEELEFLKYFNDYLPCTKNSCVMNRICFLMEKEFDKNISKIPSVKNEFDYNLLKKENITYSKKQYNDVLKLYNDYNNKLQANSITASKQRSDSSEVSIQANLLRKEFKQALSSTIPNLDVLANIIVDIAYSKNKTKQIAWDVASKTLIKNLLEKNNGMINIIEKDINGDIEFDNERFVLNKFEFEKYKFQKGVI